jgi:hypothetical protein
MRWQQQLTQLLRARMKWLGRTRRLTKNSAMTAPNPSADGITFEIKPMPLF